MQIDSVIIRRSPVILLYHMVAVTLMLYIFFSLYSFFLYQEIDTTTLSEFLGEKVLFFVFTIGLEAIAMIILFLQWSFLTYEIKNSELIRRKGILWRRTDMHSLSSMQAVYTQQSFLGTLFNYGSIKLHNPLSKEEVCLTHVPDPEKYAHALKNILDSEKEQERIIPTRKQ